MLAARQTTWQNAAAVRVPVLLATYLVVALGAGGAVLTLRGSFDHPEPWFALEPLSAHGYSALLGVVLGLAIVAFSRWLLRLPIARELADALAPATRAMTSGQIVLIALLSSLGEELLFRGLLAPYVGVVASSVLFASLHQVRGRARWLWMSFSLVVGLFVSLVYRGTGSLLGPLVAHALINALNLHHLRGLKVPRSRRAEGLLSARSTT